MHLVNRSGIHGVFYPVVEIVLDNVAKLREFPLEPNHFHLQILKALLQFLQHTHARMASPLIVPRTVVYMTPPP